MPTPPESADRVPTKEHGPVSRVPCLEQSRPKPCQPRLQHIFPAALETFPAGDIPAPMRSGPVAEDLRQRPSPWVLSDMFAASTSDTLTQGTPGAATVSALQVTDQTSLWPAEPEAGAFLDEYRGRERLQLFPFVVIPPALGSVDLRQQRPFLWKAVMMEACHHDGARQIVLGNQLLKDVTEAAYTRPHKNIDLLQGLQILIWSFHYNLNSSQTTNLLYLARSLSTSLGLNEAQGLTKQDECSSQCLEQMRALAASYYLVTV